MLVNRNWLMVSTPTLIHRPTCFLGTKPTEAAETPLGSQCRTKISGLVQSMLKTKMCRKRIMESNNYYARNRAPWKVKYFSMLTNSNMLEIAWVMLVNVIVVRHLAITWAIQSRRTPKELWARRAAAALVNTRAKTRQCWVRNSMISYLTQELQKALMASEVVIFPPAIQCRRKKPSKKFKSQTQT